MNTHFYTNCLNLFLNSDNRLDWDYYVHTPLPDKVNNTIDAVYAKYSTQQFLPGFEPASRPTIKKQMKEITGNIFDYYYGDELHAICCTTNGVLKADGSLVMGKGIALEFVQRYGQKLAEAYGHWVKNKGNTVCPYTDLAWPVSAALISFPTKHDWRDKSDLKLIEESAKQLVHWADKLKLEKVYLTRPGCGNGGLNWAQVKPILAKYFDDRFYIITPNVTPEVKQMKQDAITSFQGEYRWLSNFWPCKIRRFGTIFDSTEAAFAASKCTTDLEKGKFVGITAAEAKKLGRTVEIRPDWNDIRVQVMRECLEQKFAVGSELAAKLLATNGRELIEGNTWGDKFWGVCNGQGENMLGKLLMERRDMLQQMTSKLKFGVWTDGACEVSTSRGGWAYLLPLKAGPKIVSGYAENTTANRMELEAVLQMLKAFNATKYPQGAEITIHTDSANVIGWLSQGWKRNIAEISNLCSQIDILVMEKGITLLFVKVAAHSGDVNNELVDQAAVAAYMEKK